MRRLSGIGGIVLGLGLAAFLATMGDGIAATRGVTVTLKASEASGAADAGEVALYDSSYALVIGNDAYHNTAWPRLSNAVQDARSVAAALEAQGFEVTLKTDLDGRSLGRAFEDFFIDKGGKANSRLFVWFAGHGFTLNGEGFLIPVDGTSPDDRRGFLSTAISLRDFGKFSRYANSKHVYAVFDSCFAGTIFNVARSRIPPAITRITTEPVRQFLSSGDAGQQVSDDGRFARMFVEALQGRRRADANADGYLTAKEIGAYLSYEVSNLTSDSQTPRYGELASDQFNKGDFVFVLPGGPAVGGSAAGQPVPAGPDATVWATIQNSNNAVDFYTFLATFPNSPFAAFARARLDALGGTQTASLTPSGPTAPDIREAQRLLSELRYSPGPADGVMGDRTERAIEQFQRSHGLAADGAVSDALLVALRASKAQMASIRPAPVPAPQPQATPAVGTYFRPGQTFKDCADCPEMIVIPPGSFEMGSNDCDEDEKPMHRVDIRYSFAVGKYEVTQAEWAAMMGSNPSYFKDDRNPVEQVNWNDVKEFVRKLSSKTGKEYRLLSESEWEYAARAGARTKFWCGDSESCLSSAAVFRANSGGRTAPVGSRGANAFGLHDTMGNVWEWVEDCYVDSYRNTPTDGSEKTADNCFLRILRGGSWSDTPGDLHLRSADRFTTGPGFRFSVWGFRVARSLPRTP